MNFLKRNKEILFLLVFCVVFFCIYSNFNLLSAEPNPKFSSPDETANYFWIERMAAGESLYYFEELNGVGNNLVHARSLNTVEGKIVPGSFLGMIFIYGFLAKVFGLWIVPYLTPLFGVLGIIFFYLLIKQIFGRKEIALISAVLLSFLPPWLYYSARGLYHNILFLSLFLIGVYLLLWAMDRGKFKLGVYALSGFLIGLAVVTRTSEIVWLALSVLFVFVLNFKKIYWPGFILFLCGLYIPALMLMYSNQILYGAVISAGYGAIIPEGGVGEMISNGLLFRILITPFGFDLKSILVNGFNYLYQFLPYWSLPTILGGFLFILLPKKLILIDYKKRITYVAFFLVLMAYLLVFYGSWGLVDRIDQNTLSLGTSYLRYFLPIYMLCLPFLATLVYMISRVLIWDKLKYYGVYRVIVAGMLIAVLSMPTLNLVIRKTDESLFLLRNLDETRAKSYLVNEITREGDVVVMYKQADKIFFPDRKKLITALAVDEDYEALRRMVELRDVYYYTFAGEDIVDFISKRDFEPRGMKIVRGAKVFKSDWIYIIELK